MCVRHGVLGWVFLAGFVLFPTMLYSAQPNAEASKTTNSAGENQDRKNLLSMLQVIPDLPAVYQNYPLVVYVDYRAIERAAGLVSPGSHTKLKTLDQTAFDNWSAALSRVPADLRSKRQNKFQVHPLDLGPELANERIARHVPGMTSTFRLLPDELGVEWFAIDRVIHFGVPPDLGVALGGGPDLTETEMLHSALTRRGFRRRDIEDVPLWHRFDDYEERPEAMAPANMLGQRSAYPFGLGLGRAARIAALPDMLAGGAQWQLTEAMIASALGNAPSLADNRAVRAAAEAATGHKTPGGMLLQAVFVGHLFRAESVALSRFGPYSRPEHRAELVESYMQRAQLPAYRLVIFADRQHGPEEIAVIGLVYPDQESAQIALGIFADQIRSYTPITQEYQFPLVEKLKARIDSHVYRSDTTGMAVAVVNLRYTPKPSEGGDDINRPGRLFKGLISGVYEHDIDALITRSP